LRAQNVLLAKLLGEEKAKAARLRTELIGNLTNLIVGFTDAQDALWSEVVDKVQVANEQGVGEMERWIGQAEEVHAESSRRTESMRGELVMAEGTATSQREAGVSALRDVSEGMRSRLEEYGAETQDMATGQVEAVDGFCEKMGSTAVEGEPGSVDLADNQLRDEQTNERKSRASGSARCSRARARRTTRRGQEPPLQPMPSMESHRLCLKPTRLAATPSLRTTAPLRRHFPTCSTRPPSSSPMVSSRTCQPVSPRARSLGPSRNPGSGHNREMRSSRLSGGVKAATSHPVSPACHPR
jgi:hypothetical protein